MPIAASAIGLEVRVFVRWPTSTASLHLIRYGRRRYLRYPPSVALFVCWLVGWLVDWLIGWLVGGFIPDRHRRLSEAPFSTLSRPFFFCFGGHSPPYVPLPIVDCLCFFFVSLTFLWNACVAFLPLPVLFCLSTAIYTKKPVFFVFLFNFKNWFLFVLVRNLVFNLKKEPIFFLAKWNNFLIITGSCCFFLSG